MPDDAEFERRLRDAKLAAMTELAAGAGHEINNPVATIAGRARLLLQAETDPNRRRSLATIISQALRIGDMIGDLMLFARPPEPSPESCDLSEIAREAAEPFTDRVNDAGVTLAVTADHAVTVFADRLHLLNAVSAVVENAINASNDGGHIEVSVNSTEGIPTVTVRDDGTGFTDEDREHAFDPFYSGRQAGRGLGFGLPKAWRIITLAGGMIDVASKPGETIVIITLPAS